MTITKQARKIKDALESGMDTGKMLVNGLGDSEAEIDFIIEQLRQYG